MATLAGLWHSLHPYCKTVLGAAAAATAITAAVLVVGMAADVLDAAVANWFALWKFMLLLWSVAFLGSVATLAFHSTLLTDAQRQAIRDLKEGKV